MWDFKLETPFTTIFLKTGLIIFIDLNYMYFELQFYSQIELKVNLLYQNVNRITTK